GPELLLALVGKALQVLDVDPGNRTRHQFDVAHHAHAVGAIAPGTATHGELLLDLGELALKLAPFIHDLSEAARQVIHRYLDFRSGRLGDLPHVPRGLARGGAGERLDAPHAGRDTRLADHRDQPDVAGALHVRAAAELHRPAHGVAATFTILAHGDHPYLLATVLAEERARAGGDRVVDRHQAGGDGRILDDHVVGDVLDALDLGRAHRLGMREVEAQPLRRHERALLGDVIA